MTRPLAPTPRAHLRLGVAVTRGLPEYFTDDVPGEEIAAVKAVGCRVVV